MIRINTHTLGKTLAKTVNKNTTRRKMEPNRDPEILDTQKTRQPMATDRSKYVAAKTISQTYLFSFPLFHLPNTNIFITAFMLIFPTTQNV